MSAPIRVSVSGIPSDLFRCECILTDKGKALVKVTARTGRSFLQWLKTSPPLKLPLEAFSESPLFWSQAGSLTTDVQFISCREHNISQIPSPLMEKLLEKLFRKKPIWDFMAVQQFYPVRCVTWSHDSLTGLKCVNMSHVSGEKEELLSTEEQIAMTTNAFLNTLPCPTG
ncbi:MAG: hypothetical protein S4CHLAM45_08410 [Chlamydiales bacterium]|nr:hypothetical protein [Chlamydiales bacterium]MCH9620409.1 hypothetical protein [Chlamydiales bacterium]MCH9622945.1 hypothetical protein [Chlamydiales bacterium]